MSISLFFLAGFAFEPHSLWEANFQLRMSIETSAILFALSTGIVLARPERGFVSILASKNLSRQRSTILLPVGLACFFLLTLGSFIYYAQMQACFSSLSATLEGVEKMKINEVQEWRTERKNDGRALSKSPDFIELTRQWLQTPSSRKQLTPRISSRLEALRASAQYTDALFVDPLGQKLVSLHETSPTVGIEDMEAIVEAQRSGSTTLSELYKNPRNGTVSMDTVSPLYATPADAHPFAYILLRIDPKETLYRITQGWPGKQNSGEILFARRDGDTVLFLNALRRTPDAALRLRVPISRASIPAVKAALGYEGIFIGRDYANVAVISCLQRVPDSQWLMVSKIDLSEVLQQWNSQTWPILALIALTIVSVSLIAVFLLLHYARYIELKEVTARKHEQEARFRALFNQSPDPIFLLDNGQFTDCNQAAYEALGFSTYAGILNLSPADISPELQPDGENSLCKAARMSAIASREGVHRFEWQHCRLDKTTFYVQVTLSRILLGSHEIFYSLWQDLTAIKKNQEDLRASEERYRSLITATSQIVWNTNVAGEVINDLPTWRQFTGQPTSSTMGTGWLEALHPEDREKALSAWGKAIRENSLYYVEYRMRRHDGVYKNMEVRGAPVLQADGNVREWVGTCTDITGRKQYELALQESENLLRFATKTAAIGIWVLDFTDNVLKWDDSLLVLFDAPCEIKEKSLYADFWQSHCHPDDLARTAQERTQAIGSRTTYNGQYRIILPNGTIKHVHETTAIVQDQSGNALRMVGILQDLTERIQAEERFQLVVEHSPIAKILINQHGCISMMNHKCEEIFGYPRNELMGRPFTALLPEELCAENTTLWKDVLAHPEKQSANTELNLMGLHKNGHRIRIEIWRGHFYVAGALYVLVSIIDVSAKYEAEQLRQETERRLRTLFDNSPDAYFVIDPNAMKIMDCNHAAELMLGGRHEQIMNLSPEELVPVRPGQTSTPQMAAFNLRDAFLHESGQRFEWLGMRLDGSLFWCDISASNIMIEDRRVIFAVWRDISRQKALEARLEDLVQKLNQSLKISMQANEQLHKANTDLEQFAFVASHDLQEPLRKIQSFGEMLGEALIGSKIEDAQIVDYVTRMQSAAQRMRSLIDNLLAFSRVSKKDVPMEPMELREAVRCAYDDYSEKYSEANAHIHIAELPAIEGNLIQFTQLFSNLFGNAYKFRKKDDPLQVDITCELLGALCRIRFIDNGIGFEQQYAERIFGIFQRLHGRQEYEGTGIGLAICRKIVERHHGSITATGTLGKGATFTIELPLRQPPQ